MKSVKMKSEDEKISKKNVHLLDRSSLNLELIYPGNELNTSSN